MMLIEECERTCNKCMLHYKTNIILPRVKLGPLRRWAASSTLQPTKFRFSSLYIYVHSILPPASWSSGQSFWLLIMRSRVRFSVLPWGFFLEGKDFRGSLVELRLRPLLVLHIHISPSTSTGQRSCAPCASQNQKSVTLRPQSGGEITKSIRDMWWHWTEKRISFYG
jgi:hypothetical protein